MISKSSIALALCASLLLPSTSSALVSPDEWDLSSGARQTDSEWLSLTRANETTSTASVQSKKGFGPADVIKVDFEYVSWGGAEPGADGLAIYLFDANATAAGAGGGYYSALGYCGVAGAYIGIGLDEFGNFSFSCEGKQDGTKVPNSATIRGPQTADYGVVKNVPLAEPLACSECTTRDQAIARRLNKVSAYLLPRTDAPGYSVNLSINGKLVIHGADYPHAAPAVLNVGISASNGSLTNHHEIRNLKINATQICKR